MHTDTTQRMNACRLRIQARRIYLFTITTQHLNLVFIVLTTLLS